MSSGTPHILVLGGGFGGLSVATEIRKRLPPSRAKITVIDKKDWFMVGFAKLWIIRGTRTFEESVGSLHRLTRNGISFVKAEIEVIDPEKREVATSPRRVYIRLSCCCDGEPGWPRKKFPAWSRTG